MSDEPRPYTLVAELTYRCPLRCVYCSNPLDWAGHGDELTTEDWLRVLREAEELGVVQLNLTGGEPLLRDDLEALVEEAQRLELYTNLITSGIPLSRERLERLKTLGLDNVQVSIQDVTAAASDRIAGLRSFDRKLQVARWVKELGLPLTVNTVLHRDNLDGIAEVIALAESLDADRLELANTQYLGWALVNRPALLPTREQLERARDVARAARQRLSGRMEVLFVTPDYYAEFPKACMDGWGRRFIVISPDGLVLPCHAAHTLPGLTFDNVRQRPLGEIWRELGRLHRLPRRVLDGRAVPELRAPERGLRRLPVPGVSPHRRRGGHRPGVHAVAAASADRDGAGRDRRIRRPSSSSARRTAPPAPEPGVAPNATPARSGRGASPRR